MVRMLRRHRLISVAVLVCASLLLLAFMSACGSPATGVESYTSEDFGYSFAYPAAWELRKADSANVSAGGTAADAVGVFNPEGAVAQDTYIDLAQVTVYKLKEAVDASMMPQVRSEVEQVLASLESQAPDMQTVEPLSETTLGGTSGFKVTYAFSQNGTPTTSTLYFLFFGDTEYQLTLQAATQNWGANQSVFTAFLASFRPGPGG